MNDEWDKRDERQGGGPALFIVHRSAFIVCCHADMMRRLVKPFWISTQYTYSSGAVKKIESKRSRNPPCPGIRVPESFTAAERFHIDSARSPTTPEIERMI